MKAHLKAAGVTLALFALISVSTLFPEAALALVMLFAAIFLYFGLVEMLDDRQC